VTYIQSVNRAQLWFDGDGRDHVGAYRGRFVVGPRVVLKLLRPNKEPAEPFAVGDSYEEAFAEYDRRHGVLRRLVVTTGKESVVG
jgi:hypothetical protein